jgi:predicted restriction endonuclease
LRCENPDAKTWLSHLASANQDGSYTPQLKESASKADDEGYFEPGNLEDQRERKLREIVQRRGQPEFRNKLVAAYDGRCAVTGCDAVSALEAAHITPYLGPESNHVTNGLLLRADIHTLLDLNFIGIDPESLQVALADQLRESCYEEIDGQELTVPDDAALS